MDHSTMRRLMKVTAGLALMALTAGNSTAAAQERSDGPTEGIKVHGHWVIEVRNPDGTLVERREFENGLRGGDVLLDVLARRRTVGAWEVDLFGSPFTDSACAADSALQQVAECRIIEGVVGGPSVSGDLTSDIVQGRLVLNGSIKANRGGNVAFVQTVNFTCLPTAAPIPFPCSAPTSPTNPTITGAAITKIIVAAGQIIQVRVEISFS